VGGKQVAADRLWRVWELVQEIAARPGQTRHELARRFALSERQVQADLDVIREELGLAIVRHQGYRFRADQAAGSGLTLHDARVLADLVQCGIQSENIHPESLRSLARKLPSCFPVHLQPLVRCLFEGQCYTARALDQRLLASLLDALLEQRRVRLYLAGDRRRGTSLSVLPLAVLPRAGSWWLLARAHDGRRMALRREQIAGVTLAATD
jgi:predicted DNA-binding transcriptional regulator YafY